MMVEKYYPSKENFILKMQKEEVPMKNSILNTLFIILIFNTSSCFRKPISVYAISNTYPLTDTIISDTVVQLDSIYLKLISSSNKEEIVYNFEDIETEDTIINSTELTQTETLLFMGRGFEDTVAIFSNRVFKEDIGVYIKKFYTTGVYNKTHIELTKNEDEITIFLRNKKKYISFKYNKLYYICMIYRINEVWYVSFRSTPIISR